MRRFVLRRVLLMIPTLFGISLLTFGLANATPGDPTFVAAQRNLARTPTPGRWLAVTCLPRGA